MNSRTLYHTSKTMLAMLLWLWCMSSACNNTKYIKTGQHLLRKNTIRLKSDKTITGKGELKDNLSKLVTQKPNTGILGFPYKLWLYNIRYKRYEKDSSNFQLQSKTVEKPVIFDSSQMQKSVLNLQGYMHNQGYFYSRIKDTVTFKKKKAFAVYNINAGDNYLVNKVFFDADDSTIAKIINKAAGETGLKKNTEFNYTLLEDERSRITSLLRDHGYYRFSQDNVTFQIDTLNKAYFHDIDNPLEGAVSFIQKQKTLKPTLDVKVIVRLADDPAAYVKYTISKVQVYPDYANAADVSDSTMLQKTDGHVTFRYHNYYVKQQVLLKNIFLLPGKTYSQADYDKTIVKLNELGIFQYIRVTFREDPKDDNSLDCTIMLNRIKKHDFSVNYEVSSGSTYSLGNSLSLSFRDKNIDKGADLLTTSVTGGVETIYDENYGKNVFQHFFLLTEYYGFNASLDFPKFIAPLNPSLFANTNVPHTIISVGTNSIDRVDYFTLINTSASFKYNWRESPTVTWNLSPIFANIIRLPVETDSFKNALDTSVYLTNTYKPTFIEGENISFTYSDDEKRDGKNYSFLSLGFEEAGGLLGGLDRLGTALNNLYNINYAQYVKFDFDGRHYFTREHSVFAFRFYGGIGIPYGQSTALPYIKQYYVGGPYSLRGWRIRTLGPGSDTVNVTQINSIDRTGDIKLEANGEYRFDIAKLFSGAVKMNGALFVDAGNIWLTQPDPSFPGGNFEFNTLGQDIAVSTGAGLRFDIASFLTVRLDLAIPIKKPYDFSDYGWVLKQIDFSDPTWRADNIVFNFAIGYPF